MIEPIDDLVRFANRLADVSGDIVRPGFRVNRDVIIKPDQSPVTEIDRKVETELRRLVENKFPDHGIIGEEFGDVRVDAEYVWIFDPIDGTKGFTAGLHHFGTLIALANGGEPVIGVLDQPITNERWVGVQGRPTTFNGKVIETRSCNHLPHAIMATSAPDYFHDGGWDAYKRLNEITRWTVYGAGCHGYAMLAAGFIDVAIEAGLDPFDYCALVPIVENAGGVITDWDGARLTIHSGDRIIAAGDARIHHDALAVLQSTPDRISNP
ncbi:MAG: histidinol phosphate phosphatase [Gammaproteobacteria bacterium]|nr:histidinol phosphate phosphatase [Gammaproteobacteria bacterium]